VICQDEQSSTQIVEDELDDTALTAYIAKLSRAPPFTVCDVSKALFQAIQSHEIDFVRSILSSKYLSMDANRVSCSGYTALVAAAQRGDIEMAELLLSYGAKINAWSLFSDNVETVFSAHDSLCHGHDFQDFFTIANLRNYAGKAEEGRIRIGSFHMAEL
jgi:hypothetical protein